MEFNLGLSQKIGMPELPFNNKSYFLGIPIDSSTVFDIVTHQILLKKLLYYGISNKTFKRLLSYLSNRKKNYHGWGNYAHTSVVELSSPKATSARTR